VAILASVLTTGKLPPAPADGLEARAVFDGEFGNVK
jgi:hypothetical protein